MSNGGSGEGRIVPRLNLAMGNFATGIAVVTARGEDGLPLALTANSLTSVSVSPPLVMVTLARESETLAAVRETGRFAINILADPPGRPFDPLRRRGRQLRPRGRRPDRARGPAAAHPRGAQPHPVPHPQPRGRWRPRDRRRRGHRDLDRRGRGPRAAAVRPQPGRPPGRPPAAGIGDDPGADDHGR